MNILLIAPVYPSKNYPTNIIFVHKQAKTLISAGHKVTVLDLDFRSIRWKRKFGCYKDKFEGVDVYRISIPLGTRTLIPSSVTARLCEWFACHMYECMLKEGYRFHFIFAHFSYEAGNAASVIKKKYNIPFILMEHSSGFMSNSRHMKNMEKPYKNGDVYIAVSEFLARQIKDRFGVKPFIVPNVLDQEKFFYKDIEKNRQFTVVTVSRLIKWKRIDLLIESFIHLAKKYNAKLIVVGDGEEKDRLKKLAQKNGIASNVEFRGIINNDLLIDIYNSSHIFALPSIGETFGVVYLEALACGLPVVSTKCGGPESFIDESCGRLVDVDDKQGLAEALEYMYSHYKEFDRKKISETIIKNYGRESYLMKMDSIFKGIENVCS